MSNAEKDVKEFISYEYKEITTDTNKASLWIDGYEAFGWEQDKNVMAEKGNGELLYSNRIILRFKRNRKIMNKMELTRLQRNFDACISEIEELERNKYSTASIIAIVMGIFGSAFMAGSVFAITAQVPNIMLGIFLAIPAFLGWILPYFIYKKIVAKRTIKIVPLIEAKYDEIYELCEKGNKLLH